MWFLNTQKVFPAQLRKTVRDSVKASAVLSMMLIILICKQTYSQLLQLSDTFLGAWLLEEFLCVSLAGRKYSQACRQQYLFQDNL